MGWFISRQEATAEPEAARQKAMALFQNLHEVEEADRLLMSILADSVLIVEAYRGARHQIPLMPELQRSVDALLKEIKIVEQTKRWASEPVA